MYFLGSLENCLNVTMFFLKLSRHEISLLSMRPPERDMTNSESKSSQSVPESIVSKNSNLKKL